MLKPYELDHAEQLRTRIKETGVEVTDPGGPFGRTLAAIEAYRHTTDPTTRETLAELICLYALGIVRGDGEGIRPTARHDQ